MKIPKNILIAILIFSVNIIVYGQNEHNFDLKVVLEFSLGNKVGSLRAVPVHLKNDETAILVAYSADKDIDPSERMFYCPTDKLKMAVYSLEGKLIWKKELDSGAFNGTWFFPIYPFDLDNDGSDEIYFVNNIDPVHILNYYSLRLETLDCRTGERIRGRRQWKKIVNDTIGHTYRHFIFGGHVKGEPVLITAQGTYGRMGLQAWNKGMKKRWELIIEEDEPGSRGSHMTPILDINNDGVDEILWGERCISMDDGRYLFIADKNQYRGHSDVIQPTLNRANNTWSIFTCRETPGFKPRVVMFNDMGKRIWTDLEEGHMDAGWTAHVNSDSLSIIAFTINISGGRKIAGPDGFFRTDVKEYAYNAVTGEKIGLPFKAYSTVPVDLDGDGYHEFACALGEQSNRKVYTISGKEIGFLGEKSYIAMASKFMDLPGEQILCYYPDGEIKIWADKNAKDSQVALDRYKSPYYKSSQALTASGYNKVNLGGL